MLGRKDRIDWMIVVWFKKWPIVCGLKGFWLILIASVYTCVTLDLCVVSKRNVRRNDRGLRW